MIVHACVLKLSADIVIASEVWFVLTICGAYCHMSNAFMCKLLPCAVARIAFAVIETSIPALAIRHYAHDPLVGPLPAFNGLKSH